MRFSLCRSALAACGSRLQIERGRNLFGSCISAQDPGRYLVHTLVPDGNSLTPDEPRGAVSRFPSVPQSSFSSEGARSTEQLQESCTAQENEVVTYTLC